VPGSLGYPRHVRGGPRSVALVTLWLVLGGCVRYVPAPVEPAEHLSSYRARRLEDSGVVAWVSRYGPPPEAGRWTDRQLALLALGTRAELDRARADWHAAQKGEERAGARPRAGAQADVERAVSGSGDSSPWVVALAVPYTVELGGKRGARVRQARAHTAVVESDLRGAAWRIAVETRDAAASLASADEDLTLARRQVAVLSAVETLERARFEEGSLTSAELARTRAEVQDAMADASVAEGAALESRAALAGALAVPVRALDGLTVVSPGEDRCAVAAATTADSLAALTLNRRPEIGRALAEYAVAEADLQLEVARQYPDLDLGPGFIWDQGVKRWTLALALPNLLGSRNRGAINEAVAARAAVGAHVAEVQDDLLAELDVAIARCRGAMLERTAADSQAAVAERLAALARAAYERGETSRLEPALAELAVVRAARVRRGAEIRLARAGRGLERVLGEWAGVPDERWPDPRAPGLNGGSVR
jgi:outer membrane protein, heavy metal efflux system